MKHLEKIKVYLDGLTLRERTIVLLAAICVVFGLWFVLWFDSASKARDAAAQRLTDLSDEQRQIEDQIEQFNRAGGGAAELLAGELRNAKRELKVTDEQLSRSTSALVSADQLAQVLQEILAESSALALISLQTLSVEPVSLQQRPAEDETDEFADTGVNVYRHGVVLTVRGRYFEVLDLITKLESKRWKFYWQSLHYQVQSYPEAEVQIRVYTLSAEEGLLGV